MKKLLAILLSFILVIGTVIGVNAVVYYYGAGGPDMTLNYYIDSSKVPTTNFTELEMKIFSSFNTYAEQSIKLDGKWVSFGTVKVESSIEGAELTTGYTESQGAVTIFKFKSEEGFEIADNQPFLSITNVNATLYTGNDSIDYIVDKLVGSDGTDYADKDAVTTDLKIPEGTYYTHPCEGALKVNNLRYTEATEPTVTEPSSETQMTEPTTDTDAASFEEELADKFYNYCVDYCVTNFGANASDFENWDNTWGLIYSTKVRIFEYTQADDIVYFSGLPSWIALEPMSIIKEYGNWRIYSRSINCPSELGLYVMIEDKIYTIEEAWEQGLVTDLTTVEGFSKYTVVTRIDETQSTSNPAVCITLTAQKTKIYVGETTTVYWSVSDENMTSGFKLTSSDTKVATVSSDTGKVKGVGEGTAVITASVSGSTKSLKITVAKRVNPMKVTTAVKAVKYSTVKKKAITVKPITVSKAQGKVTYKKLSGNKKITVNTKTGKFTVKKGTKKSTYTIKVKVTAAGNTTYKSGGKTVTVKIKVK